MSYLKSHLLYSKNTKKCERNSKKKNNKQTVIRYMVKPLKWMKLANNKCVIIKHLCYWHSYVHMFICREINYDIFISNEPFNLDGIGVGEFAIFILWTNIHVFWPTAMNLSWNTHIYTSVNQNQRQFISYVLNTVLCNFAQFNLNRTCRQYLSQQYIKYHSKWIGLC